MSKQEDAIKSHSHYFHWEGSHAHNVNPKSLTNGGNPDGGTDYDTSGNPDDRYLTNSYNKVALYGWTDNYSAGRNIVDSSSISVSGNTNATGQNETRPENFTIRVWKRIT